MITLNFKVRITGVTGNSFLSRTRQNVKKRVASIIYIEDPPDDAVKLAYAGTKELTPQNNLSIGDRSDELYANSRTVTTQEFIGYVGASSVGVKNKNFLVTQVFAEADSSILPLYYKHILSTSIIPETVKLLDKDSNIIDSSKYFLYPKPVIDEDTGIPTGSYESYVLYNSLENTYNNIDGSYEVYFVQASDGTTITTEILNNEKAFREATWEDFWTVTSDLKPWEDVYTISDDYTLTLPAALKYAIKYLENERISIKMPVDTEDTEPWFPRVVNGGFSNGYGDSYIKATYDIKEFSNQAFCPYEPYKMGIRKRVTKIADRLLKLAHEDIQLGTLFSKVYIIFENDGVVEYAITNDEDYDGVDYRDFNGDRVYDSDDNAIQWSTNYFLGIDRFSGFVHVGFDIKDSYDIFADYSYREKYYTLSGLPMNPIFDSSLVKEIRVPYIVPRSIPNHNISTQTVSVRWLSVPTSGRIESCNQDHESDGNDNINLDVSLTTINGYSLTGILGMHYSWRATTSVMAESSEILLIPENSIPVSSTSSFPRSGWLRAKDTDGIYRYFSYTNKDDTSFVLGSSSEVPTGDIAISNEETIELVNFIDERTTLSNRVASDEEDSYGGDEMPSVFSQYFILAEMSINPPHSIGDIVLLDLREDGGGIREDKYEEAKLLNPEVQWYNDFGHFSGQIYPGKAVLVIKLPITILNKYTLDNLKAIITESVPMGVWPMIRFYGYEPRVISVLPGVENITVTWEKEGDEFVYDVWYMKEGGKYWIRANSTRVVDSSGENNSYTISGLDSSKKYSVRITMKDKYYQWWHSYDSYDSIGGGYGLDDDTPVPPFGNVVSFKINIL